MQKVCLCLCERECVGGEMTFIDIIINVCLSSPIFNERMSQSSGGASRGISPQSDNDPINTKTEEK